MTVKNNKSILMIIILLAIIVCVFGWLDISIGDSTVIYSENGEWDLRNLPFENISYILHGQVEYIPDALLTPEEFSVRESEAVVGYPQDVAQHATSRIRILLPDDGYYAFSCRSIDFSEKLYVNGEWILDIGQPGSSKETTIPDTGKISLTLKPNNGVIEIVQQASNFVHRDGGGHAGWNVSSPELRIFLRSDFNESIKLGCFLALFFIHIILFMLLRSYRANLYFALFCLMWFLRTGVTGAKVFTDIFPWLPWTVKFRIEYLAFPVTAVLIISLLNTLFPSILHKWFRYALYAVSAVIAALFLFADTVFMSYALVWCEALYIPAIIYIILRFTMKLRSIAPEQGVFLAGVGMFFLAAVHDMLYYNDIRPFPIGDLSSVSMLLLTFCEAAAVFIATVRETEKVSSENAALKENARMIETQIEMQREQYERITENAEAVKIQHHDLRHQLAVIKGYNNSGDTSKLNVYLDELVASMPASENTLCENFAVNAVALHYLSLAKSESVNTSIQLVIPEKIGRVRDSDLCIIVGNFLENAVEACKHQTDGERFIRVNSRIQDNTLTITMDNSFNGNSKEKDGIFYSSKHDGEGVGLSSIRAVARRYGGNAKFEVKGNVFLSSVYIVMV